MGKDKKILLEITNQRVKISGDLTIRNKIFKELSLKHPKWFFVRSKGNSRWDGMIHFVSESGYFRVGLFERIINLLDKYNAGYEIEDNRNPIKFIGFPNKVGNYELRDYQLEAIKTIRRQIGGIEFFQGTLFEAPNSGKTIYSVFIHLAFKNNKTLFLINDSDLMAQFKREIPQILGSNAVGYIQAKDCIVKDFTIGMVQTLSKNIDKFKYILCNFKTLIIDECDLADNNQFRDVIQACTSAYIRVGLSGTMPGDKLKRDMLQVLTLESYFGKITHSISQKELVEKGVSARAIIKIFNGYEEDGNNPRFINYDQAYNELIDNIDRTKKIYKRVLYNINHGHLPLLIIVKWKRHVAFLDEIIGESLRSRGITTESVHSETPNRDDIFKRFRLGETKVLISSLIVKRGKNLPLIRTIINAAGGQAQSTVIQLMGRGHRLAEGKKLFYYEDFFDSGRYLSKHSRKRLLAYKSTGFRIMKYYTIKK